MIADDGNPPLADPSGLLEDLRVMWDRRDPAPGDLAERIVFSLSLEDLEVELARLEQDLLSGAGARGEERVRTLTFTSSALSVMVLLGEPADMIRLDGWIDGPGTVRVELRRVDGGSRTTAPDTDGRFAFDAVPSGLVQLVLHVVVDSGPGEGSTVVTPAFQV